MKNKTEKKCKMTTTGEHMWYEYIEYKNTGPMVALKKRVPKCIACGMLDPDRDFYVD